MRITCLFLLLLQLVCSCRGGKQNFALEVDVKGAGNEMVYLALRTLTGTLVVDSAMPDKSGTYRLAAYTSRPDFYILYQEPRHYINLIIHPGDKFRIITEGASFDMNYLVEGSKDSRLIQKMVNMQTRTLEKITEISTELENSKGSADFEKTKARIDKTYDQIVHEHQKFSIQLIEENPRSLVSLMALYQQLGRNTPVFDYKRDFNYYALVDSNLFPLFPESEAVIDLNRKVTELRDILRLEIGSPAPDITLPDRLGNPIALSSLKGKNVLLVFWASWSSQSQAELRKLSELYPKAAQNMEFYLVSLDRTRESWLKYADDSKKAYGIHVSDLKYWDSPVVELYHIEQLPAVYLIDRQGIIRGKNVTAEVLRRMMEEDTM